LTVVGRWGSLLLSTFSLHARAKAHIDGGIELMAVDVDWLKRGGS
jgi:hypothetical protein